MTPQPSAHGHRARLNIHPAHRAKPIEYGLVLPRIVAGWRQISRSPCVTRNILLR